jgi:hypothetical protein
MSAEAQIKSGSPKIIIGTFVILAAIAFGIAAMAHLQLISFFGIAEPRIVPASIVEGLCCLFFVISGYRIIRGGNAWRITFFAHGFSIAGIILGQISLAVGAGPRTESNDIYHSIMLLFIISDAFYLLTKGKSITD